MTFTYDDCISVLYIFMNALFLKVGLGGEDVRGTATSLVMDAVTNPDPIVRCAAGEALGRIAQVVGSPAFTSSIAQKIFEPLRSARDAVSRTGHSVALGCLHRYVGGMGAGHHLNTSVSILLALSQDNSSSIVQVRTGAKFIFCILTIP
jgi:hypothetical protein